MENNRTTWESLLDDNELEAFKDKYCEEWAL